MRQVFDTQSVQSRSSTDAPEYAERVATKPGADKRLARSISVLVSVLCLSRAFAPGNSASSRFKTP